MCREVHGRSVLEGGDLGYEHVSVCQWIWQPGGVSFMQTLTGAPKLTMLHFMLTCVHRQRSVWIYFKKTYVMELVVEILQSTILSDATLWMNYNKSYYME